MSTTEQNTVNFQVIVQLCCFDVLVEPFSLLASPKRMYRTSTLLVRFFPQSHYTDKLKVAQEVRNQRPSLSVKPLNPHEIRFLRLRGEQQIWRSITNRDWDKFEDEVKQLKSLGISFDEVTYTLLCHGYILSHRHPSSAALLVIGEMRAADMHPSIVRLNERLIHSQLELTDFGIRCRSHSWQNFTRLAFMSAARLRRTRQARVALKLKALDMDELFAMNKVDVLDLIRAEHEEAREIVCDEYEGIEDGRQDDSRIEQGEEFMIDQCSEILSDDSEM